MQSHAGLVGRLEEPTARDAQVARDLSVDAVCWIRPRTAVTIWVYSELPSTYMGGQNQKTNAPGRSGRKGFP